MAEPWVAILDHELEPVLRKVEGKAFHLLWTLFELLLSDKEIHFYSV